MGGTPPSVIGEKAHHGGLENFLQAAGGNPVGLDGIAPVDAGEDGLIRGKAKGTVARPDGVPQTAEPFGECVEGPSPEIKHCPLAGIIEGQVAGVDGRDFGNPQQTIGGKGNRGGIAEGAGRSVDVLLLAQRVRQALGGVPLHAGGLAPSAVTACPDCAGHCTFGERAGGGGMSCQAQDELHAGGVAADGGRGQARIKQIADPSGEDGIGQIEVFGLEPIGEAEPRAGIEAERRGSDRLLNEVSQFGGGLQRVQHSVCTGWGK